MEKFSIKKNFSGVGQVEYKVVSSKEELEGAMALVYQEYLAHGYILPKYYKSKLRITLHNALPGTTTFIARKDGQCIGAVTLIPDTPFGLPMDEKYKDETDRLRRQGRKICEVGQLATVDLFGAGLFSMFNFKKLDFVFSLFKLAFQYALYIAKFDDICIVVNPKAVLFKFLLFEEMGGVKYYGFDRISIKRKPAIARRLDLRIVEERVKKYPSLGKMFMGEKLPEEFFTSRFYFKDKESLRYFFVEKSEIFKDLLPYETKYIRSTYGLTKEEFNTFLKK